MRCSTRVPNTCNWRDANGHIQIVTKLCSHKNVQLKDILEVLCIANSLVYEQTTLELGYMFAKLTVLEKYNEDFASPTTEIIDGPAVYKCKCFPGHQSHDFLAAEGISMCGTCQASLCQFCTWNESNEDGGVVMCFECKWYNIAGEDEQKTESEM